MDFTRPASGFRFAFGGLKTNSAADAMQQGKYPLAQNVRGYSDHSTTSRPQLVLQQSGAAGAILALEPTIGVYKIGTAIYAAGSVLDSSYAANVGCSILPYRPNAASAAWEYVFDQAKSTKSLLPGTVWKAGIAEPQAPPDACPTIFLFNAIANSWSNGGTAGALTTPTRSTDTVTAIFNDPSGGALDRFSLQVGTAQYQIGEQVAISQSGGGTIQTVVLDVLPPVNAGSILTVHGIFYLNGGTTGRCVVVPTQTASSSSAPQYTDAGPSSQSYLSPEQIASLRRGALVVIGAEVCLVLSATSGPDGTFCFEVNTIGAHSASETINGIPAIVVGGVNNTVVGQAISAVSTQSSITVGVGTLTQTLGTNPFNTKMVVNGSGIAVVGPPPQQSDYIHLSVNVSDLTQLIEAKILFDVGDGSFTQNYYYYTVRPNDIAAALSNASTQLAVTQLVAQRAMIDQLAADESQNTGDTFSSDQTTLGTSQWSEIWVPISSLTRVGNDQSKTLANCGKVQILVNTAGTITFQVSSVWVGGGDSPDVGDQGMPYFYRFRGRNSQTGAASNPSPIMRYGVNPRRQSVQLSFPAAIDAQVDTYDIERFGGSLTSWKYIGSVQSSVSSFTDIYFDSDIANNDSLATDNYEPWPSIDNPFSPTYLATGGITLTVRLCGFTALVIFSKASAFTSPMPATYANWLPGNLVQLGGQNVYTLFKRPVQTVIPNPPAANYYAYLFQFVEHVGFGTTTELLIQEPTLAAQGTGTVWGPDANGRFFAVGAGALNNGGLGFRAGLVQWSNANNPDGASDANTSDLCPPSEPLLNGALIDSVPVAFSPNRAWAGYPKQDGGYNFSEIPVGRGLAAQFGICSDGQFIYFVGKDGIYKTALGVAESLTNEDLYNLFPHEGLFPSAYTYAGQTIQPPDYKYAQAFRLSVVNGFLYFDYQDSSQVYHTLVCDLRRKAWCLDVSGSPVGTMCIHAGATTPASPSIGTRNQQLFVGDAAGAIWVEQSSPSGGSGESVACLLATKEEMMGDLRANKLFGDASLDTLAAGGNITVTPTILGTLFGTTTTVVGAQSARAQSVINLLGGQIARSLGLLLSWSDQGQTTTLYSWQPSYVSKPEDTSNRATDFEDGGFVGAKYVKGCVIEADTGGVNKSIQVQGNNGTVQATLTVNHNGQVEVPYSFTPFIAHELRLVPADSVSWRFFKARWIFDEYPENTALYTSVDDKGFTGDKFVRGLVLEADSGGSAVNVQVLVDGGVVQSTFAANHNGRSEKPYAFNPPFVAHDLQLAPQGTMRIFKARWIFDEYPELAAVQSAWSESDIKGARFVQGLVLRADTAGLPVVINVLGDNNVQVASFTATHTGQTEVAYAFPAPFIAHQLALQPQGAIRIWESRWVWEPTPEQVATWITQATSHGLPGYQHLKQILLAYNASATVTLTVTVDGVAMAPVTFPATSGYAKSLQTFPPNKGLVFKYALTSANPFQVWMQDCELFVKAWGARGPYINFRNLGAIMGEKATI